MSATGRAKLMCSQYQENALIAGSCETIGCVVGRAVAAVEAAGVVTKGMVGACEWILQNILIYAIKSYN